VNHAKLSEAPTARVVREMGDQQRVMQEALRSAPDPSQVAELEKGAQLSEELLREVRTREEMYETQLHMQVEQAAALWAAALWATGGGRTRRSRRTGVKGRIDSRRRWTSSAKRCSGPLKADPKQSLPLLLLLVPLEGQRAERVGRCIFPR
jgi:hypothetical protein